MAYGCGQQEMSKLYLPLDFCHGLPQEDESSARNRCNPAVDCMTLLPIVGRELRVASRQGGTYWTRVIAAGLAMLVGGGFMAVWTASAAMGGANMGQILFSILKWLCFAFVCCTGLFLTSDTLSEEKREGTLGLLFLTDLRGYDVVLGKLVATSLRCFYALLAFFPVLGITLMVGGVSGTEFWRSIIALCNALFFSLAAGVFISAFSRDTIKAMSGVMALCFIALGFPPLLDLWRADWDWTRFVAKYMLASPAYAMVIAPQRSSQLFWQALALPHATSWLLLGLASFCIPHTWQEKSSTANGNGKPTFRRWRFLGNRARLKSLNTNPVIWLAGRDQWITRCARVVFLGIGTLAVYSWWRTDSTNFYGIVSMTQTLLTLTLYLWVAAQATRFLSDARRNGALELILCTPVTVSQIVKGQWFALMRTVWIPVLVVLCLQGLQHLQTLEQWRSRNVGTTNPGQFDMELYQLLAGIAGLITLLTGLLALGWFGMLMGLKTRKTSTAMLKTVCFVQVLPWLVLTILQSLLMMASVWAGLPYYGGVIIGAILGIGKDLVFILVSRRRLYRTFRNAATESAGVVRPAAPAPTPVNLEVPPVIPA